MNVELDLHVTVNYDAADGAMPIEGLENAPPCLTFYDLGDQMKNYLHKTFLEKIEKGALAKTAIIEKGDPQAAKAYQQELRKRFIDALGGLPEADCELNPVLGPTVSIEADNYTIRPLTFTPRANVYATANLYTPTGLAESGQKAPAVLFVCGHSELAKAFPKYQNVCQTLARAGFVVLAMDPVGQGERYSYYNPATDRFQIPPCCPEHDYVGAQALLVGDSIARYFLHDARRAVDYLCTLPYVDTSRIAVAGNSGGGTQTGLMMLGDDRIAAAAIGTVVTGLPENMFTGIAVDAEQVWNGLVQYGFDHDDIMIAMAPKPVIVLASEYDYFPIEGTRRTTESARRFYKLLGDGDALKLFSEPVQHGFSPNMAERAAEFFTKHLMNGAAYTATKRDAPNTVAALQATATGQVRAQYPDAVFIFEENLKRLPPKAAKQAAKAWLKERVNYNRKPVPFNIRRFGNVRVDEIVAESILYWSNENVFNNMLYITPDGTPPDAKLPVSLAIWDGGSKTLAPHLAWIRETCRNGRAACILDVTGTGPLKPNRVNTMPMFRFEGTFCEFSHIAIWQNDSLPALWTWDVLRALDMLKEIFGLAAKDIGLYCLGRFGVYGRMANFILDNAHEITHVNPPKNMTDIVQSRLYEEYDIMSHVMPGMLKYFDYSDL